MTKSEITSLFKTLPLEKQQEVPFELSRINITESISLIKSRGIALDNKDGNCTHCESLDYVKYDSDKGGKRIGAKNARRLLRNLTENAWIDHCIG